MSGTNIGTAYVTIMPSAKGISGKISSAIGPEATSAGKLAGGNIAKGIVAAIGGAAVVNAFKQALDAGGAMQQSFGGLDTIYGDASEGMKELAYDAAKAGISANSYAEQAVSFGASLRQAFGGDLTKAAESANTAILDMADNSAKMGTDMSMIQNAYQGFAKQNYTMLDNLKLGYGGTKTEMERLLSEAEKLPEAMGKTFDINNLGDVYEAIHLIQGSLGITGVAAAEAEGTFTGSMGSMRAAWDNLKADLALGKDITDDLEIVAVSAKNFLLNNMLPMVANVLKGVPKLISEALTSFYESLPGAVDKAIEWINGLVEGLSTGSGAFAEGLIKLWETGWGAIAETDWAGLAASLINLLWTGLQTAAPIIWDAFKTIGGKAIEKLQSIDWPAVGHKLLKLIGEGIAGVGNLIWDGISALGREAKEFFTADIDWAEAGSNAFHAILDGLKAAGEFIWDTITDLAEIIRENFIHPDVDWGEVGNDILTGIGNGMAAIGGFLYETVTTLATSASDFFRDVDWEQAGKDAVTAIAEGLSNLASNIWEAITTIGTTARDKLTGIDWKKAGSDVLTAIKDGLQSIGSLLWGALQGLGSLAKQKLLEIDWVQSGLDIINGIIGGISSFGYKIGETLLGYAQSAWSGFKSFFEISSPSKLMRDTAKWIPLGIAEGIEQESDAVTDAMNKIAADTAISINPTADYSAYTPSGSLNNISMVFNVYDANNPEEFATRAMQQLRMEMRLA